MPFEAKLAARDTPSGRLYEAKVVFYDCVVLIAGTIGLAMNFPPIVYLAAVAHLIANFCAAPVKWLWPILEGITLLLALALFVAALYAVQVYYFGFPSAGVIAYLKTSWLQQVASAIVLSGVVSNLLAYPGNLSQLVEQINRAQSET